LCARLAEREPGGKKIGRRGGGLGEQRGRGGGLAVLHQPARPFEAPVEQRIAGREW
jgi:hypothetical protein